MKTKILQRLENYKKHRQEWIDKQKNHQWTMKERDMGSELYGTCYTLPFLCLKNIF